MAALRRIFDRVGEKVNQNLVDPGLISHQVLMPDTGYLQMELLSFCLRHRLNHRIYRGYHIIQRKFFQVKHYFSALNFGDVQNIVNQAEEVLAGGCNFLGVLPHLGRILRLCGQKGGKSQHRVHRRADIVGHIGEKHCLGLTGNLRRPQSLRQLLAVELSLQLLFLMELILLSPVEVI